VKLSSRQYETSLLSGKQVLPALTRLDFVEVNRKGSHLKMKHADGRLIVFPFHDEVDRFTLKGALRDAEIEIEDFLEQIR
jgi:predicted RNA binding protein YcfA (HicA-like mRNA interferase family)